MEQNCLVVETSGYLNNLGGEKIAGECHRHIGQGVRNIIIDLQQTKMVNSIGISILIEIIEELNEVNGRLFFTNLDPTIEKTFTIMGLFQYAARHDSTEAALEAASSGASNT
jgi:anti-anti-sigma factor